MAAIEHSPVFPVEQALHDGFAVDADLPAGSPAHADDDEGVLTAARAAGFCLLQCETDRCLVVWEWRRGTEPRPQFGSRRVALHWMSEYLGRATPIAYVSERGAAFG
jgi:hypothetical protein